MSLLHELHLIATAAYCALLWVVQIVVYPQFRQVPADAFARYHAEHTRRMGWVVGPIFLLEGATAVLAAAQLMSAQPILQVLSLALFALGTLLTAVVFVPIHRRLAQAPPNQANLEPMIAWNWARTMASSARLIVVTAIVSRLAP